MVISLVNLKGGVGKTVSTINIASAVADKGKKVLIVDTDSQGNIATAMGFNPDEIQLSLANLMVESIAHRISKEQVKEYILHANNVDIIPANSLLAAKEYEIMSAPGRDYLLKGLLNTIKDEYEYIFIDCPPSLGVFVLNALSASDYTLIPVEAQYLSFESLREMIKVISMVQLRLNPTLCIAGILITMYQARTNMSKLIREQICAEYGESIKVFDEVIPYSVKAAEQTVKGKSLIELEPTHPISLAYKNIAKELMNNGG